MERNEGLRSSRGFSLIESLIAIFLLTISILAIGQLMVVAFEKAEFARYDTKAVHVAQSKIEELKGDFGNEIETGNDSPDLTAGSHGPESFTLERPSGSIQSLLTFQVSWEVTDLAAGQKQVEITVTPPYSNPRTNETLTLTTTFAP